MLWHLTLHPTLTAALVAHNLAMVMAPASVCGFVSIQNAVMLTRPPLDAQKRNLSEQCDEVLLMQTFHLSGLGVLPHEWSHFSQNPMGKPKELFVLLSALPHLFHR